jgi:hypothetical protein
MARATKGKSISARVAAIDVYFCRRERYTPPLALASVQRRRFAAMPRDRAGDNIPSHVAVVSHWLWLAMVCAGWR